jgi:intermembrane space import and assembly protein 40
MAHGPCGPQFREAFSCFVYSEDEPKGIDCVERFKAMQDCFREHPDVYGEEIMRDDDDDGEVEALDGPADASVKGDDDTGTQTEETEPPTTSTTLKMARADAPPPSDFDPTQATPSTPSTA